MSNRYANLDSSKKKQQQNKQQNKKKSDRPLNTSFRSGLGLFFRGLIKNNACYEGGKRPWWNALILGFLGIMIALIPTMVTYGTKKGSDFITATSNPSLEVAYSAFMDDLAVKGVDIEFTEVISGEGIRAIDKDDKWEEQYGKYDNSTRLKPFVYTVDSETLGQEPGTETIVYEAYYLKGLTASNETTAVQEAVAFLQEGKQINGELRDQDYYGYDVETLSDGTLLYSSKKPNMHSSFTIFASSMFITQVYNTKSERIAEYSGRYNKIEDGFLLSSLGLVDIEVGEASQKYAPVASDGVLAISDAPALQQKYNNGVYSNFNDLYDIGRHSTKWSTFWGVTGVTFAVYVLMIFLLGFVIWLTNHGKRNPLRPLPMSLWIKTTAWLCFTPFVLCLLGFFMPEFTPVIFVLTATIRTMWFSFRSLKPGGVISGGQSAPGQPTNKPLPRGKG